MDILRLSGPTIEVDAKRIRDAMSRDRNTAFLYYGESTLYDFIHDLQTRGHLDGGLLYQLRVCYARNHLDITVLPDSPHSAEPPQRRSVTSMAALFQELDGRTPCRIVVNSDSRSDLAFITQQLVYVQYPLDTVDILLRREESSSDFLGFARQCGQTVESLDRMLAAMSRVPLLKYARQEWVGGVRNALRVCESMRLTSEGVQHLNLAVAASQKTGKSTIINCFLGERVAPTDNQLATPNTCVYEKSPDKQYHLRVDGESGEHTFSSREEFMREMERRFRAAQSDRAHGFTLPNMRVSCPGMGSPFSRLTIYDTPGPDAAGTSHREAALQAVQRCDLTVFAIDYQKYLIDSEVEYLREIQKNPGPDAENRPLLIALNKMDANYMDPKAFRPTVAAVDFIRERLTKIAEEYRDCVIFPTCAMEYLCALEAESAGVLELQPPTDDLKKIKFAHRDVPALAWLHNQAINLEDYCGVNEFSYETFKRDSGMPALMGFVLRTAARTAARRWAAGQYHLIRPNVY